MDVGQRFWEGEILNRARFGICGNIDENTAPEHNPIITLRSEQVQNMVLDLNQNPMAIDELLAKYPALEDDVEKLIRLGVLRDDGNKVYVNFTLFSAQDKEILFSVCGKYAATLAELIAEKQGLMYDQLSNYKNSRVDVKKLAFMVVGCYFLDWGALELMNNWDFVVFGKLQAGGNSYTLWGEEAVEGSLKGVYWGGHSYQVNSYLLHSFGDHESSRNTFPDLLWRKPQLEFEGSREYHRLLSIKRRELGMEICEVLASIGKQGIETHKLHSDLSWPSDKIDATIAVLKSLHYITEEESMLRLEMLYFTEDDIDSMVAITSKLVPLLRDWLDQHLTQIKVDLANLIPIKNGVPFKEVFNQVWHYIFGLTNKALAEKGVIHDTYCEESVHLGHVPALIKGDVLEQVMARCV